MTLDIAILIFIIATMAYFFFTEKLPMDLTAFLGLGTMIVLGYVKPEEAFAGFSSPAVIIMLSIFFISGALLQTGVADLVGDKVYQIIGSREVPLMIAVMLLAASLSAFMNNVAATAILLPAVASLAKASRISPSRLFMPLSFGTILGGTMTLVGTPPNIVASEMLQSRGLQPFALFEFAPIGFCFVVLGTLYMTTWGRKLLPQRDMAQVSQEARDLASIYRLKDNLYSIRVPGGTPMVGMTLKETRLGTALGLQVVSIVRGDKKTLAPTAETQLLAGDLLVVQGQRADLDRWIAVHDVSLGEASRTHMAAARPHIKMVLARVRDESELIGKTPMALRFRDHYQALIIGLRRGGEFAEVKIATEPIQAGDELLLATATASKESLERIATDFAANEADTQTLRQFRHQIFILDVGQTSALAGRTLGDSRLSELVGLTVLGILRGEEVRVAVGSHDRIEAGDHLYVVGEPSLVRELVSWGKVEVYHESVDETLESDQVGVVEAALAPRSEATGKTLAQLNFRERFGLQVLAIWRGGQAIHGGLADTPLQLGDALLLQGPWRKIRLFATRPYFVVLSQQATEPRNRAKAPHALGVLCLMILAVVLGWQPMQVTAFICASLVVLLGALTMQEAYRAVEWRSLFLVAAVLPVGTAMERTGAAALLSHVLTDLAGPFGPYAVFACVCVLSSVLSQCLDGAPAVVLLTPVALKSAEILQMSPKAVMMAVAVSASVTFMTPFSHKANLLVMGAGGYHFKDYLRVGTPLSLLLIALVLLLIPWIY